MADVDEDRKVPGWVACEALLLRIRLLLIAGVSPSFIVRIRTYVPRWKSLKFLPTCLVFPLFFFYSYFLLSYSILSKEEAESKQSLPW